MIFYNLASAVPRLPAFCFHLFTLSPFHHTQLPAFCFHPFTLTPFPHFTCSPCRPLTFAQCPMHTFTHSPSYTSWSWGFYGLACIALRLPAFCFHPLTFSPLHLLTFTFTLFHLFHLFTSHLFAFSPSHLYTLPNAYIHLFTLSQ